MSVSNVAEQKNKVKERTFLIADEFVSNTGVNVLNYFITLGFSSLNQTLVCEDYLIIVFIVRFNLMCFLLQDSVVYILTVNG